ncbi:beta-N-acetylhexosaminidase [Conyzicola lurida]|uniref:Beta-N-acetylhexosaminidase n=1 Tax=Conyzicola lurida TaxID=1172621 RepID=A0A841AJS6_9MICO|nr:glycoside hydrolase family 3 protein [Conyzicola lurida]MBB5841933.1 beta-N-acetylhexosaminidase [Conyzicola lurida]
MSGVSVPEPVEGLGGGALRQAQRPQRPATRVLLPGFVGTELPDWLAARLRDGLAGVCLFGENVESRDQLRALTAAIYTANPHALIAIDEEGGDVTRLYQSVGSPFPGNALLGRIDDLDYTALVATAVGLELRDVGVNLNFAPDVDINSNANNPVIGVRSFGSDPALVARHSAAWVAAHEATGVAVSAKHFPGHGDTAQDSHLALPVVDLPLSALRERELLPFEAAVAAGASSVMSSHILLPQLDAENPATFSRTILDGLLRGDLGFTGVIVSDALDMVGASGETGIPAAAVRAIAAGCDLLCIGTKNTDAQLDDIEAALAAAVAAGELDAARLADAGDRNVALAVALRATSAPPSSPTVFDLDRAIAAFAVAPGAVARSERTVVAIETAANIAVGVSPWGPPADARVHRGDPLPPVAGQLVLVGKNNHAHEWVRELVDAARRDHPATLVVDMGWPDTDRRYADVATFGASRHVGEALAAWLEGTAP